MSTQDNQLPNLENQIQQSLANLTLSDRVIIDHDLNTALGDLSLEERNKKCRLHDIPGRIVWAGPWSFCKEDCPGKLPGTEPLKWTGHRWEVVAVEQQPLKKPKKRQNRTPQQQVKDGVAKDMQT